MSTHDDGAAFVQALARGISVRVIVFVPNVRKPRSLWISAKDDDAEIIQLEAVGRSWLAASHDSGNGQQSDGTNTAVTDGSIAVAPARAEGGNVVGALVVAKEPGGVWTAPERALVQFAAGFYGSSLDRCASRPQPGPSMTLGSDRPPNRRPDLERGMRAAPGNGELFLVYQPELDLSSGEVVAVEALVRWNHPQRGELSPESFITLAEQSGVIMVLGAWVIDESLREFASWNAALPGIDVSIRVNVSPVQIAGDDVVMLFADALCAHGLRGEQVCVEITENPLPGDVGQLSAALRALKELGISSAIDDLASGYSTLGRLRLLPVDIVKIDRSLVTGIDDDWRAQAIVGALVRLAGDLGVGVVAEGVETAAEAAALVHLGCSRAQGHLFARPMNGPEMLMLLRDRGRATAT